MHVATRPARHAERPANIISFVGEREIASVIATIEDPFGTSARCALSPDGRHHAIGSCGDVVCAHCARIFWA